MAALTLSRRDIESQLVATLQGAEVEEAISQEELEQQRLEQMAGIVESLTTKFNEARSARVNVENRWLEDLRQYHGQYEALVEGILRDDPERSKVFINLTRPKTTAWEARLWDLLFPADGKNWGINPTPVPELADDRKTAEKLVASSEPRMLAMVDSHNAMAAQQEDPAMESPDPAAVQANAQQMDQLSEKLAYLKQFVSDAQRELDAANRSAELMERQLDDYLVECNYSAVSRDVIADACKLGVGIMKGPVATQKAKRQWLKDPDSGSYMLAGTGNPRPIARRVNPWHFFPDPEAESVEDMEHCFERHLRNRSQLMKMAREMGFNKRSVEAVLREGPQNDQVSDLSYLTQLKDIGEDAMGHAVRNKFIVIEYHGPLAEEDVVLLLRGMGEEEQAREIEEDGFDPFNERDVVAYFCQGRMLKIAPDYPMDSCEKIYSVFSFEKGEASILDAKGVPRLMRSEQAMLNSAVRMLIDNGALAAGSQIVIDKSKVEPENGSWKFAPRKVWIKKGEDMGQSKAFEVFNIPANTQYLVMIVELARKLIDEVITMPMIAQGEQGMATGTLGGMSMLFNSANVVFRRVVKNWDDDITAPMVRRFYDWEMQFGEESARKGDMQCEARGTSVLLVREIQSQQLMAIAMQWSTHPIIGPAVRVYDSLRLTLQALAINPGDVLVGEDEFEERVKRMAEEAPQTPESIRADAQLKVAEMTGQSRLAQLDVEMRIADANREVEIMKLMQKDGVDLAKIQALLEQTKIRTDSDERKLAVETAIEQQNAEQARREGLQPTGSGGAISMGRTKP